MKRFRPRPLPTSVFSPDLGRNRGKREFFGPVWDKTEAHKRCAARFWTKPWLTSVARPDFGQNRVKKALRVPILDQTETKKRCAVRFWTKPSQKSVARPDFGQNRGKKVLRGLILDKTEARKLMPLRVTAFAPVSALPGTPCAARGLVHPPAPGFGGPPASMRRVPACRGGYFRDFLKFWKN